MKDRGFNKKGLCRLCKEPRTEKGHDPCIADLPGVLFACCGHGVDDGYIKFEDGRYIRFVPVEIELDFPKHMWVQNPVPIHVSGDSYRVLNFPKRMVETEIEDQTPIEENGWRLIRDVNPSTERR